MHLCFEIPYSSLLSPRTAYIKLCTLPAKVSLPFHIACMAEPRQPYADSLPSRVHIRSYALTNLGGRGVVETPAQPTGDILNIEKNYA